MIHDVFARIQQARNITFSREFCNICSWQYELQARRQGRGLVKGRERAQPRRSHPRQRGAALAF
eukprot:10405096-Alexandrium_andersonii.AAC.1